MLEHDNVIEIKSEGYFIAHGNGQVVHTNNIKSRLA